MQCKSNKTLNLHVVKKHTLDRMLQRPWWSRHYSNHTCVVQYSTPTLPICCIHHTLSNMQAVTLISHIKLGAQVIPTLTIRLLLKLVFLLVQYIKTWSSSPSYWLEHLMGMQFERLQLVYCENCTVWRVQLKLARQGLVLGGEDLLKF